MYGPIYLDQPIRTLGLAESDMVDAVVIKSSTSGRLTHTGVQLSRRANGTCRDMQGGHLCLHIYAFDQQASFRS